MVVVVVIAVVVAVWANQPNEIKCGVVLCAVVLYAAV